MNDLKVALVTGAASGMGRISSKRLAADGVHVAAVQWPSVNSIPSEAILSM